MTGPADLAAAEARTRVARAQLFSTLAEIQERLKPSTLAQDAVETAAHGVASVARKGAETVRTKPVAAAAIAGTIGLVLARGWFGKRRHLDDATAAEPASLKDDATHAKKGHG